MASKKTTEAPKPSTNGTHKPGLRVAQVRILGILAKAKKPMTKTEICAQSFKDGFQTAKDNEQGWMFEAMGSLKEETRLACDERMGYPSLITLKFIRSQQVGDGVEAPKEVVYEITASGKKALEKAVKEAAVAASK